LFKGLPAELHSVGQEVAAAFTGILKRVQDELLAMTVTIG